MAPQTAFPPLHTSLPPTPVSPSDAETILSAFLTHASKTPHLHPDAMLTTTGINFSAHSGPTGGLAIHHLRRVAAALRGENLVLETREELEALFGEEVGKGEVVGERDEAGVGRRERSRERVREWDDGREVNVLGEEVETRGLVDFDAEGEEMESWRERQTMLEGELGERDGAPVERQNGRVPVLRTHDERGAIKREAEDEDGVGGAVDKAARKRAKKERRLAERKEKAG